LSFLNPCWLTAHQDTIGRRLSCCRKAEAPGKATSVTDETGSSIAIRRQ